VTTTLPGLVCDCGRTFEASPTRWLCDCGGLLSVAPCDLAWSPRPGTRSLWRYVDAVAGGTSLDWAATTLGEGLTPTVPARLASGREISVKLEFVSPTGSFKDRGAAVLIGVARALGVSSLVADSSGNAGTAVAAYAARAGIEAEIFVPEGTSSKKLLQVEGHGARVVVVPGDRQATADAACARVEESAAFYASHVYNPYFYEGTKTYAFEVFEDAGGQVPDTLVLPVGNGTLVLGAYLGFGQLRSLGLVDRLPRIVAVQAERCAPVARELGMVPSSSSTGGSTAAEGIAIPKPERMQDILKAIRATEGRIVTLSEDEIVRARASLARQGIWAEPTGAVSFAAAQQLDAVSSDLLDGTVVAPVCGSGLKSST
jgi:threonine synthase